MLNFNRKAYDIDSLLFAIMMEGSNEDILQIENIESELKDGETTPLEYDIAIIPADFTLEVLYLKWQKKEIIIPKFQRSFVWTIIQASRLIESFMMGLPIPPIYFYVEPDQKNLVIDGRQRLQSIFYFFDGYFGEPDQFDKRREFKLDGINEKSRWYKKKFEDFSEEDQRKLKNSVLRTVLVSQNNPKEDHTSIFHIFERLNTGGTSLQDQEVRNCVFAGKLNHMLLELNTYENWRKILGKPKRDVRQKDVQLILRYMSLFHYSENYRRPMKDFLSEFMDLHRDPPPDFIEQESSRFKRTCTLLIEKIGERPFNPKGGLNPSVFDSIFIAFANNIDSCPEDIKERLSHLRENQDFQKLTSEGTTNTDVVQNRLRMAEEELFR